MSWLCSPIYGCPQRSGVCQIFLWLHGLHFLLIYRWAFNYDHECASSSVQIMSCSYLLNYRFLSWAYIFCRSMCVFFCINHEFFIYFSTWLTASSCVSSSTCSSFLQNSPVCTLFHNEVNGSIHVSYVKNRHIPFT